MRTIETLSMKKKLLSTNQKLKDEKFYTTSNIKIWDLNCDLDFKSLLLFEFDNSKESNILKVDEWLSAIGL